MSEAPQNLMQKIFGIGDNKQSQPETPQSPTAPETAEPKKKNLLEKIFGGGDNKPAQPATPPQ
jgi:hypothetical protein